MCGIAGRFNFDTAHPVDRAQLVAMTDAVAHRGPDAGGYFLDAVLPRLKITSFDISADGERVVWIDAWPEQFARQQVLTDELLRRFRQAFGEDRVLRRDDG